MFEANVDNKSPVANYFNSPIQAFGFRILPTPPDNGSTALRIELKGCKPECKYSLGYILVLSPVACVVAS